MSIKYGFELEGFALNELQEIVIPEVSMPVDGFPGLVELRTTGGATLEEAWACIVRLMLPYQKSVSFNRHEYKFSGSDMATLRRGREFSKRPLDVKNIYGKQPRRTVKTLASLQINISNLITPEYKHSNQTHAARYGLLDTYGIVKRLDKAFESEIKTSNRQKGMYAIKDGIRLEYRSLPNFVFNWDTNAIDFLSRIREAVES